MRMAGAKAGKEVGEHLMEAGVREDEAVKRVLNFLEYCKVGRVAADETIRIKENCESVVYRFMTKTRRSLPATSLQGSSTDSLQPSKTSTLRK